MNLIVLSEKVPWSRDEIDAGWRTVDEARVLRRLGVTWGSMTVTDNGVIVFGNCANVPDPLPCYVETFTPTSS